MRKRNSMLNVTVEIYQVKNEGFPPGGSVVKNPPDNSGNTGSMPDLGPSHMLWSN